MTNEQYLILIYKNIQTAIQSIEDMFPKFRSSKLKQLMKQQEQGYLDFKNKCQDLASNKEVQLKDNNFVMKVILISSISINTMFNKSSSHIAELFLLGTVRGTIKLYKHAKNTKDIDDDILALCKDLLAFEEKCYNDIREYLKA